LGAPRLWWYDLTRGWPWRWPRRRRGRRRRAMGRSGWRRLRVPVADRRAEDKACDTSAW